MSFNVSRWSIRNPVATTLLFILLTVSGIAGFLAMNVQNFPDMDFPIVTVTAALPGASPAQLENEVVRKIEDSIANAPGIKHIKSSVSEGVGTISAEFHLGTPVQEAMDDVRDSVSAVRGDLPSELQDPVIKRVTLAGTPVLTYALSSSTLDDEALSWFFESQVRKRLLAIPGVGAASRIGGVDREVRVDLDPVRLLAFNVAPAEISSALRDLQQEAAGGRVQMGGAEQSVRTVATVQAAQELAQLKLSLSDGRQLRLDELATVLDTTAEPRAMALLDGRPVVAFDVLRARGAGELEVADAVRATIATLRSEHADVAIVEAVSYVDPIAQNYAGSMALLLEGAALAIFVVFCFLRDWRATLVAAVALPLSAIPTFGVMHLMGFTLNTISLLSLSLVIGVLVDDAIVEIENIERHLLMGKPPLRASIEATDEIGLAVVATTFTLIAVFLPTSLMGGTIGRYFVQFGWTAAIAIFFSLVVARMLTPMMAAYLLRLSQKRKRAPRWVLRYLKLVRLCLDDRSGTLGAAIFLVIVGLVLASRLPGEFMPPDDSDLTQVTLTLPPGSVLQDTVVLAERARSVMKDNPDVQSVYTSIGSGASSGDGPDGASTTPAVTTAVLIATLTPRAAREGIARQDIEAALRRKLAHLPGIRMSVGSGGGSEGYELVLASDDGELLAQHVRLVERELRTLSGIGAVTSSASLVRPELVVRPDFARAASLGVTTAAIAETLRVATSGDYDQNVPKLNLSERQIPVVVRLAVKGRDDLATLRRLPVPGARGHVPLESVADLDVLSGPAELTRYDRMRNVNITVELNGQALGDIERLASALPSLRDLPPGVFQTAAGGAEIRGELVGGFAMAMAAGILCVYMVLVLLLKDFVQPLTVLTALVLSIPGAFLALWVTGSTLSMPSMIGLIMLMGITTKNSILLVDYIILARREFGMNRRRAIIDACRKRARPIVMTSIAMGAGMLPIALGWGADPSFRAPMAIVVIGGLVSSTVFCLLVVPVVYSCVDDAIGFFRTDISATSNRHPVVEISGPSQL